MFTCFRKMPTSMEREIKSIMLNEDYNTQPLVHSSCPFDPKRTIKQLFF